MKKSMRFSATLSALLLNYSSYAGSIGESSANNFVVSIGAYHSSYGQLQHVDIQGLIGNNYTISNSHNNAPLVGLGYFRQSSQFLQYPISFGVNAFYLFNTKVAGEVIQENLFPNLAYSFKVSHLPIYATAKTIISTSRPNFSLTLDAGIGPNFLHTSGYRETPLDSITLPDNAFSSKTKTNLSGTLGIGLNITNGFNAHSLNCGYRLFYLGEGELASNSSQILNPLKTGSSYANAIMCSVTV